MDLSASGRGKLPDAVFEFRGECESDGCKVHKGFEALKLGFHLFDLDAG